MVYNWGCCKQAVMVVYVGGRSKLSRVSVVLLEVAPKLGRGPYCRDLNLRKNSQIERSPEFFRATKITCRENVGFLVSAVGLLNVYKFRRHSSPMPTRVPIQGRQRPCPRSRCYLLESRVIFRSTKELVLLCPINTTTPL